ncbi:MAG: HU family DNA-binding protein [Gammaproteobacteria bacterium]
MNLSDLSTELSAKYPEIPPSTLDRMLRCLFKTMKTALVNGQRIEFRGFGSFNLKIRPERLARNPKTGQTIPVPAITHVRFKPGKEFKARVNSLSQRNVYDRHHSPSHSKPT